MAKSKGSSRSSGFGKVKLSSYKAPQYSSKNSAANSWNNMMSLAAYRMGSRNNNPKSDAVKMAAQYLGIKQVNKPHEMQRVNDLLAGADSSWARAKAAKQGIKKYDSYNDYLKILGPSKFGGQGGMNNKPVLSGVSGAGNEKPIKELPVPETEEPETPKDEMKPPDYMGGGGAGITSAMGFRRKKSSWKAAGLSTKGTSSLSRGLTISGLNI